MLGYGRDKSAPTPGGVFVVHFVVGCGYFIGCSLGVFVGVRWYFSECSQRVHSVYVT